MEERNLSLAVEDIRQFLEDDLSLKEYLAEWHPADVAELIEDELDLLEAVSVFSAFDDAEYGAEILRELSFDLQLSILLNLSPLLAGAVVRELPSDDLADIIGELDDEDVKQTILQWLPISDSHKVEQLAEYEDDTAGGIMVTEYISLPKYMQVKNAVLELKRIAEEVETFYYVYVVESDNRLFGVLSFRDLFLSRDEVILGDIATSNVITAFVNDDQEDVAQMAVKYNLLAVPVVDNEQRLQGIITYDDLMDVIEEEATEDVYQMAAGGAPVTNEFTASTWQRVKRRIPWLLALLVGELLSGGVIQNFSSMIQSVTILAFFIPVMSGEAGNVSTQSLAVVVRGLAVGDIDTDDLWRVVWGELKVGVVLGVLCGATLFFLAQAWQESVLIGIITGVALCLNIIVAACLGGFFPILIDRWGIDPAVASGPFITTTTDIISLFIFFMTAKLVLGL